MRELAGTDLASVKSAVLAEAIKKGDATVEAIVRNAARLLGLGVAAAVNLMAPDRVVLGGGLVEAMPKLYLEEVKRGMEPATASAFLQDVRLRSAALGDNAGVLGAAALARRGLRLDISDTGVFPQRRVKTALEVQRIRLAQRAAVAGMQAAWALLRAASVDARGVLRHAGAPLTGEQVRRAINLAAMALDCVGGDPIVACGEQAADPHGIGHGPLHAGEPIVLDIFPQHAFNGYWGDLTRTVCKGPPKPGLRAMHAAVAAAQRRALATVRAGISGSTVHSVVQAEFERRGFKTEVVNGRPTGFIHSTGHGVGLEIHEEPSLGPRPERLQAGAVVTVEPGLYYPGVGGVRIEDTVLVTSRGAQLLAPCARGLVIP